jgi:hypothetical protein
MNHRTITVSDELYGALEKIKRERERELGISLSWDQFMVIVARQMAGGSRNGGGRGERKRIGRSSAK